MQLAASAFASSTCSAPLTLSPSQTTVLMNRLAGRGWVRELGERPSKFALTDKSLDVLPYPSALSSALEQRVNHALTEDQQALLAQLLWKVLSA